MSNLTRQLGEIERHLHKEEIVSLAVQHGQMIIDNGDREVLSVYVELKRYETYLKGLITHLKEAALEKALQNGKDKFNYEEATVRITHRVKWNYSTDGKWLGIHQLLQELTSEKKEREEFLKENNGKLTIVDQDTGEVMEGFDLSKEITQGIAVQL